MLLLTASPLRALELIVLAPSGPVEFGAAEIARACAAGSEKLTPLSSAALTQAPRETRLVLTTLAALAHAATAPASAAGVTALRAEGFRLVRAPGEPATWWLVGADAAGAMYAALEAAELIRGGGAAALRETEQAPAVAERGIKFNLPLDARSPSYSDASDSAQQNIATVWDLAFWRELIDRLARDRYNLVSLWNLHPFPSLVRVPEYPDVALADVLRSRVAWRENYALQATGLDAPEILGPVETLRHLTIDEKIEFWRAVMRYGRERNVKFFMVTWNVFTNGVGGKLGITPDLTNATTADYFRRSVRELVLTYPDLAGIGLTTGENMPDATPAQKEDWAFRTYGQGVLDALERQPERKITFIHRQHEAGAAEIARRFAPAMGHPRVDFLFSFKYAEAHALSATTPRFHEKFLADIGARPTLWTLRNDDAYVLRWGAPDFVREFLRHLPAGNTRGFYYGSDQWIWGREFLDLDPTSADAPRVLEYAKHQWHWALWGRLGYDPALGDERLRLLLAERLPGPAAGRLMAAWQDASMVYPLVTGFHWGALDFQWYVEACQSRPEPAQTPSGFHDINRFISLAPHPASGDVSIPDYVRSRHGGPAQAGRTPPELAAELHARADRALGALSALEAASVSAEAHATCEDIRAMAQLGKYYAHKIAAAVALAEDRAGPAPEQRATVARELNAAAYWWRCYAANVTARYASPIWMNRVGHVDLRANFAGVLYDLTQTGSPLAVPSMALTPGGTLLEGEDAPTSGVPLGTSIGGFSGRGYVDFNRTQGTQWIEWTFNAPAEGTYVFEVRYANRPWGMMDGDRGISPLVLNGRPARNLVLWSTGGLATWACDRVFVSLVKGRNTLRLVPRAQVNIDAANLWPVPALR